MLTALRPTLVHRSEPIRAETAESAQPPSMVKRLNTWVRGMLRQWSTSASNRDVPAPETVPVPVPVRTSIHTQGSLDDLHTLLRRTDTPVVTVHAESDAIREDLRQRLLSGESVVVAPRGVHNDTPYKRYSVTRQRAGLDALFQNLHELCTRKQQGLPCRTLKLRLPPDILATYAERTPERLQHLHQVLHCSEGLGLLDEDDRIEAMSQISVALTAQGEIYTLAA